jgi:hypothetical protein
VYLPGDLPDVGPSITSASEGEIAPSLTPTPPTHLLNPEVSPTLTTPASDVTSSVTSDTSAGVTPLVNEMGGLHVRDPSKDDVPVYNVVGAEFGRSPVVHGKWLNGQFAA